MMETLFSMWKSFFPPDYHVPATWFQLDWLEKEMEVLTMAFLLFSFVQSYVCMGTYDETLAWLS